MDGQKNGIDINVGPAHVRADGNAVVNFLLAILIVTSSFYAVYTTNQQTIQISAEHRSVLTAISELKSSQDNVFLSSLLPPEQKRDIPQFLQERAKAIVERKATGIMNDRQIPSSAQPKE